jgi:tetratricopeptide (TPR) repeat protein
MSQQSHAVSKLGWWSARDGRVRVWDGLRLAGLVLSAGAFIVSGACATVPVTDGGSAAGHAGDPIADVPVDQLYARGELMARSGDLLGAEEYLSAALQRGYPPAQALPLLLKVCLAASRLSAALNYAQPYLQLHPADYHLRYLVAAVQLGMARPREAASELRRVLAQQPNFAPAHYLMGVILRDYDKDISAATQHFQRHQALDPHGLHGAEVAAWLEENAMRRAAQVGAVAPAAALSQEPAAGASASPTSVAESTQ